MLNKKIRYSNGKNLKNNKQVSFKVDEELKDFIQNVIYITTRPNTKTDYINFLIRKDMLEILNLPTNTSSETMLESWKEYKEQK